MSEIENMVIGNWKFSSLGSPIPIYSVEQGCRILASRKICDSRYLLGQRLKNPNEIILLKMAFVNNKKTRGVYERQYSLIIGEQPRSEHIYTWFDILEIFGFGRGTELEVTWLQKRIKPEILKDESEIVVDENIVQCPGCKKMTNVVAGFRQFKFCKNCGTTWF